jgi:hypothetical protein
MCNTDKLVEQLGFSSSFQDTQLRHLGQLYTSLSFDPHHHHGREHGTCCIRRYLLRLPLAASLPECQCGHVIRYTSLSIRQRVEHEDGEFFV